MMRYNCQSGFAVNNRARRFRVAKAGQPRRVPIAMIVLFEL
jgi:hypothetical protein